jgi:hypothetical protein
VWACEDQHFPLRLSQYRERINPSLQTYLINLQPSAHFIAPESAEGVHYIAGWHSDLLYFVATMDEGATNLVNEISKVSLVAEPNEPDCGEA